MSTQKSNHLTLDIIVCTLAWVSSLASSQAVPTSTVLFVMSIITTLLWLTFVALVFFKPKPVVSKPIRRRDLWVFALLEHDKRNEHPDPFKVLSKIRDTFDPAYDLYQEWVGLKRLDGSSPTEHPSVSIVELSKGGATSRQIADHIVKYEKELFHDTERTSATLG